MKKDPAGVLSGALEAIEKVMAVSYSAKVTGEGSLEGKVPEYEAEVIASRVQAEGGGWKLYLKGEMRAAQEDSPKESFEIGYDGSTVRSLRPQENAVYEKDNVIEMSELAVFLSGQSVKAPVAWEIMDESAMPTTGQPLAYEGQRTVDGLTCDVVRVMPPVEYGEPSDPGAEVEAGLRLFIAEADHLPRRIERVVTTGGREGARVLTMESFKVNTEDEHQVGLVSFILEAPGDYTHRVVASALREGDKPGQLLGDASDKPRKLDLSMEPLGIGTPAPDWELEDSEGKTVKLSAYAGKVVVLDFWGTWCPYCVQVMPQIQKLHDAYKDKGVVVLGMNTENDPSADPAKFMKDKRYTYGLVLNAEKVTRSYRVFGFPTLYVVGRDGNVALVEQGASRDLFEKVSKVIDGELGL